MIYSEPNTIKISECTFSDETSKRFPSKRLRLYHSTEGFVRAEILIRRVLTVSRRRNLTLARHPPQRVNRSSGDLGATVKRCAVQRLTAKWRFVYWQAKPRRADADMCVCVSAKILDLHSRLLKS